MCARDINAIRITIPYQLHSSKGMVPTEVHAADARPVGWKVSLLNCNPLFRDGKHATASKYWNSFDASLGLVCRVTRNDCFLFIVAIVLNIVDSHHDLVAVI